MSTPLIDRLNAALEGRYRIERELGAGGMATVYLAQDIRHERDVAIKVLKPELAAVLGGERFVTEIRTTANLQHPHILPLFDSGEADSFLYYVMPYVQGESLRDRLDREKQLPVDEALALAKDVAEALDYAHRHEVIHRDIKPENILLHEGNPVVADFGIALAVSAAGGGRMTETGLSLGTPHYMSPEQATADRDLSARSDVYSLACVLYEMLAGDPPHAGPTAQAVLMKILTEDARPVTDLRRSVPPHVGAVLMKALEKLPADRFESAEAFRAALEDEGFEYAPRLRTAAAPRPGTHPSRARAATSPQRNALLLGALGVMAVLAAWGWLGRAPAEAGHPVRLSLDLGALEIPQGERIRISGDGRHFAVVARVGADTAVWVRQADEEEFRRLEGTEDASSPAFSPEGTWLVYTDPAAGKLEKVALTGGSPLPLADIDVRGFPTQSDWGEDGTIVFALADGLYRIPDTGAGEPERIHDGIVFDPEILPGGRGILFIDLPFPDPSVWVLDLEADSARRLVPNAIGPTYAAGPGQLLYLLTSGGLRAAPFDLDRLEASDESIHVLSDVRYEVFTGAFDISDAGTIVYQAGGESVNMAASFEGAASQRVVVADFEGTVDTLPLPPEGYQTPRWAPGGTALAYSTLSSLDDIGISLYDVDRQTRPRRVSTEPVGLFPIWSPDGDAVAYFAAAQLGPDLDLTIRSVVQDEPARVITSVGAGGATPLQWIEGHGILLRWANGAGSAGLWLVQPDSTAEPVLYLEESAPVTQARVSPDGSLAVYRSAEVSPPELFVRSFPTAGGRTQVSDGGGVQPRWSSASDAVYYWSAGPGLDTLFTVSVQPGAVITAGSPEIVLVGEWDPANWDLHPDGDRFVNTVPVEEEVPAEDPNDPGSVEAPGEPDPVRTVVVLNWFEELRARLGAGGR